MAAAERAASPIDTCLDAAIITAKGAREGDAEVSPMHANFIVNRGAARAAAGTLGEPVIGTWQPLQTLWKVRALVAAKDGPAALAAVEMANLLREIDGIPA